MKRSIPITHAWRTPQKSNWTLKFHSVRCATRTSKGLTIIMFSVRRVSMNSVGCARMLTTTTTSFRSTHSDVVRTNTHSAEANALDFSLRSPTFWGSFSFSHSWLYCAFLVALRLVEDRPYSGACPHMATDMTRMRTWGWGKMAPFQQRYPVHLSNHSVFWAGSWLHSAESSASQSAWLSIWS